MASQDNDPEDGSWITENVTIQALLSANEPPPAAPQGSIAPECGLLTRTVIESPVLQWILPVRLRSAALNDVAFIGDRFVQIKELGSDGQFHDVARKTTFPSRIRNAQVLGSFFEDSFVGEGAGENGVNPPGIYPDKDLLHSSETEHRSLPPQLLVLVLESGHLVFLFLQEAPRGSYEFVASYFEPPRKDRLLNPGFHLAIDPSSRYIITATCEGLFVVHEIEPFDTLSRQYQTTGIIRPVVASRSRTLDGVIHKADFLFPGSANQETVILILLVVKMGVSRLLTYEWAHGDDLKPALAGDRIGLRLPPDHKMPLLLIPLTVKTSFLSVSENSIAVFRDVLHGSSNPELVDTAKRGPTRCHYGHGKPLWTAWTRPFRRKAYYESKDNIYLAREDGIVFFFEINSDEILESSLDVGDFETNISTAFATVADTFSDIFILGGSCGDGSIWVVPAREPPVQIGTIPNWSPVLDFTTTDQFLKWNPTTDPEDPAIKSWGQLGSFDYREHDRVFATSGRGANRSIAEFISGLKANVILDVEYGSVLRHVWVFTTPGHGKPTGFTVLLGLHNHTAVAELTSDLGDVQDPDSSGMGFDTSMRTLAASQLTDGTICHITETSLILIGHSQTSHHSIAQVSGDPNARAENACIRGPVAALTSLSTQPTPGYVVHAVNTSDPERVLKRYVVEHEVTCLGLCTIGSNDFLVAALWQLEQTTLLFYDMNSFGTEPSLCFPLPRQESDGAAGDNSSPLEAITSLVVVYESSKKTVIVGGTRGGYFLQLELDPAEQVKVTSFGFEKFGTLPLDVLPATSSTTAYQQSVFVCCDSAIVLLEDYDVEGTRGFGKRNRVIPMDPGQATAECLQVSSVAKIPDGSTAGTPLLVVAGSRLIVASLEPNPGVISRRIPLTRATPLRLVYSHLLRCLVVAAVLDDRPTLIFLDPDTGEDLSFPTDRTRVKRVESILGLGNKGDSIHCLSEWLYEKDGKTFFFILAGTNSGKMLVISAIREGGMVIYYTRYKMSVADSPIYAACAEAEDMFFGTGTTVCWDKLDAIDRRFKNHAKIDLVSAATALAVRGRKLYVLTQAHSLEVIDLDMVERKEEASVAGEGMMEQRTRPATHMFDVGNIASGSPSWPLTLLADREGGVVGAWVPEESDGREFTIVLEAELPASVRRFRRGHTRPPWWRSKTTQPRYGRIANTVDDAEVLGVCVDGSMQHFTLLSVEAWRFLRLVQDALLQRSCDSIFDDSNASHFQLSEPSTSPKTQLHVDGDILQSILSDKRLEQLFGDHNDFELFKRYLDELDDARGLIRAGSEVDREDDPTKDEAGQVGLKLPGDRDATKARYLELGYDVLGYFLRPVL